MTSTLLAIDPGNIESGWVVIDTVTCQPIAFGKTPNDDIRVFINCGDFDACHHVAIEMIASYGMAVGSEVFDTCVWIGRFQAAIETRTGDLPELIKRQPVKLHHCHTSKAKDANIAQALVDRFAPGQPNHGKGTKAAPGWFYGFRKDVWQAYALAVYAVDTIGTRPGEAEAA